MAFIETGFEGLMVFEPSVFEDDRGYFFESYNEAVFNEAGIGNRFIQDNQSYSTFGVVRGLHYQAPPHAQSKLVRAINGSILDVAVDLRKASKTFGRFFSIELSAENKKQLFIPKGFAHGFSVLSDTATVLYKCDALYNKASEGGIVFNDPQLAIDWKVPTVHCKVSGKDMALPTFNSHKNDFGF